MTLHRRYNRRLPTSQNLASSASSSSSIAVGSVGGGNDLITFLNGLPGSATQNFTSNESGYTRVAVWLDGLFVGYNDFPANQQGSAIAGVFAALGKLGNANAWDVPDGIVDEVFIASGLPFQDPVEFASVLSRHPVVVLRSPVMDNEEHRQMLSVAATFSGGTVEVSARASDSLFSQDGGVPGWGPWYTCQSTVAQPIEATAGRFMQYRLRMTPGGDYGLDACRVSEVVVRSSDASSILSWRSEGTFYGACTINPDKPISSSQEVRGVDQMMEGGWSVAYPLAQDANKTFELQWSGLSSANYSLLQTFLDAVGETLIWSFNDSFGRTHYVRAMRKYVTRVESQAAKSVSLMVRRVFYYA